jgi:tRNA pseudouridine38-40 synthase
MRTLKLTIAYDGTRYGGWQVQPNANTIQAELERAIYQIVGEQVRTTASGRTDAGVHALGQVVSCQTTTSLATSRLVNAINSKLPDDIRVLRVEEAFKGFHAIRDAIRKRYRYRIWNANVANVFHRQFVWHIPIPLDTQEMKRAIELFRGEHDFMSFQSTGSPRKTTVRNMLDVELAVRTVAGGQEISIELEANGFLYNMVRNIVGTLVWIGRGNESATWIPTLIQAKNRREAGMTAPAKGLTLVQVWYDEDPHSDDQVAMPVQS